MKAEVLTLATTIDDFTNASDLAYEQSHLPREVMVDSGTVNSASLEDLAASIQALQEVTTKLQAQIDAQNAAAQAKDEAVLKALQALTGMVGCIEISNTSPKGQLVVHQAHQEAHPCSYRSNRGNPCRNQARSGTPYCGCHQPVLTNSPIFRIKCRALTKRGVRCADPAAPGYSVCKNHLFVKGETKE